jgi:N-acetylmuramoyl-L-alanine amidase-like protein/Big-like domain-containing protein
MGLLRLNVLAAAIVVSSFLVPAGGAGTSARPPVVWLKGEGNFTKSHRPPRAIEKIVVHVTEGAFWGSVQWLKNPRAHASSHYVIGRDGKIVQLVHLSDIAWHAGNWRVNSESVGIEHEGLTYGLDGFTDAQYRASAQLTAWIARRSLMPINRAHIIGHVQVPAPGGGRGGAGHHTDPGPNWQWTRYLRLVRQYAGFERPSVTPVVPTGPVRGVIPWRAKTSGGISRVEFSINGRVVWVDRRAPFAYAGGRGLNTTTLGNGRHVLQVYGVAGPGRYDLARKTIVVDNKLFALTSAGARPWMRFRGPVRLRVRPWGAKAAAMTFRIDGLRRAVDRRAPFFFSWNAKRAKPGKHVLEVVATSVDGRVARRRIPIVVAAAPRKPKPLPVPALEILGQSVTDGEEVTGFVVWRVDVGGKAARVEFLVDGVLRGTDLQRPFTLGWDTAAEAAGVHRLEARAFAANRTVAAPLTVTVAAP